jgi:hypothetical protein
MSLKGKNLDKEVLTVVTVSAMDLSGSADTEILLFDKNSEIHIHKVWVHYSEASSADAGVTISLGSLADDDAYFAATSEVNKDQYYTKEYVKGDLTLAVVPKNTPLVVKSAGGKTGTGEVIIGIAYS